MCSVLSGNRNFEGRIHPEVKMNYLASPPLCVAYALAGRMDLDVMNDPLQGRRAPAPTSGRLAAEVADAIEQAIESDMFRRSYGEVFEGDDDWNELPVPEGDRYAWDDESTYIEAARPTSRACPPSRRRGSTRSRARARWRCSATA